MIKKQNLNLCSEIISNYKQFHKKFNSIISINAKQKEQSHIISLFLIPTKAKKVHSVQNNNPKKSIQ